MTDGGIDDILMAYFRKRLTPEVPGEINEMILRDATKRQAKGPKKGANGIILEIGLWRNTESEGYFQLICIRPTVYKISTLLEPIQICSFTHDSS